MGLQLLNDLLYWDPEKRPNAHQALKYPYFNVPKPKPTINTMTLQPNNPYLMANNRSFTNVSFASNNKGENGDHKDGEATDIKNNKIVQNSTLTKNGYNEQQSKNYQNHLVNDINLRKQLTNNFQLNYTKMPTQKPSDLSELFGNVVIGTNRPQAVNKPIEQIRKSAINLNINGLSEFSNTNSSFRMPSKALSLKHDDDQESISTNMKPSESGFFLHNPTKMMTNINNPTDKVYYAFSQQRIPITKQLSSEPLYNQSVRNSITSLFNESKKSISDYNSHNDELIINNDDLFNILG